MEDNPIYLKIFDPSKREREREIKMDLWTSENLLNCD
jgi:hypothetical protein